MVKGNLFDELPKGLCEEQFIALAVGQGCRIERIISTGQATPPGFWHEQAWSEWVTVLRGRAELSFEGGERFTMGVGDWVDIPAGCRHRVEWTDSTEETVWLAVHYLPGEDQAKTP